MILWSSKLLTNIKLPIFGSKELQLFCILEYMIFLTFFLRNKFFDY